MEKETSKNTYVLQDDENIGTVQIADEVVAIIASLAATEVEGVSSMAGTITNELMSKVGVKGLTRGVKVEVIGSNVRVELAVQMEYGYNIPGTSQKVQERVKNAIENMTGLTVTDVNIRIAGVNMNAGKH
ncbi:MAG: Asp23/Gls24 family envelope stress response protein [Eubacteriales bacterium]|nr:Asp23/Gls24 family envelope stress response protein [Eubacteriales bacterium]